MRGAPAEAIRCIVLDDEPDDVVLLVRQLRKSGLDVEVTAIERIEELAPALALPCDILLTDYRLAGATAIDVLATAASLRPDLPVIVVSGVIDEEQAGAAFRAGARDFVTKRRLERLAPAMLRELEGAAERRRSEALEHDLAASESGIAAVLSRLPGIVWQVDNDLRFVSAAGSLLPLLLPGWPAPLGTLLQEAPGLPLEAVVAHRVALDERRGQPLELAVADSVVSCRVEPIISATGKVEGAVGFGFDVSRDREQQRRAGELATVVRALADPVLFVEADGAIASANPAAGTVLGRADDALLGMPLPALFDDADSPRVQGALQRALRNERLTGLEATALRPDSSAVDVELSLAPVLEHGVIVGAAVVARDIGRRKELEAELRHAQKLEVVGRVAGGIAHDLNNVLLAVRGYAALLVEDLEGTPSEADVHAIGTAAAFGSSLVARLLAFSRKQVLMPQVVDVGAEVQRIAPLLRGAAGRAIEVTLRIAPGLPSVEIDPSQLDQVLLNLVANARDAMGDAGTVHIAVCHGSCADGRPGVQIDVVDSGPGIPAAIAEHVFEPFFTTKGDAGSGLGLSVVASAVTRSGGTITLRDGPGAEGSPGAAFTILLPAAKADATGPAGPPPAAVVTGGRVLLVDADEPARAVLARLLARAGYEVSTAADLASAHAVLDAGVSPDVLIVDLQERGVPGPGIASLTARVPAAGVVAMSGVAEQAALLDLPAGSRLLAKPFGPEDIVAAVAAVQARPAG